MGADKIHNQMLMKLNAENKVFLLHPFNRLLSSGFVPKDWKQATVIPLVKPGKEKENAKNVSSTTDVRGLLKPKAFSRISNPAFAEADLQSTTW
jgi:hypothetical protein